MKLPPFDYACPTTLPEAVQLLAARDGDAKAIAGGQSLVPMLAFRLAQPTLLVDLRKLPDLRRIRISEKGVTLGAMVHWRDIEDDERLDTAHPLLKAAIAHVAHYQVRNRGTVGGSLAHADPAAEMPGIAITCDAEIAVVGKSGARVIQAADFFQGALTTALTPDELIVEVRLPAWPAGRRWGFEEFARRRGDFAMAAAAVFYDQSEDSKARNAHVGVIGVGDRPHELSSNSHAGAISREWSGGRSRRRAAAHAGGLPAPSFAAHRHPRRLRARRVRRLHGHRRRRGRALLPHARGAGRRRRHRDRRGALKRRRPHPAAKVVPQAPRAAVRLLHARHDHNRACAVERGSRVRRRTRARGAFWQSLPLHRLHPHRRSRARCARRLSSKDGE